MGTLAEQEAPFNLVCVCRVSVGFSHPTFSESWAEVSPDQAIPLSGSYNLRGSLNARVSYLMKGG